MLIPLLVLSCTTPKGSYVLKEQLRESRGALKSKGFISGRPQYVRAYKYPKIIGNNVYGGQWVLLNVGFEKVEIENIYKKLTEDNNGTHK